MNTEMAMNAARDEIADIVATWGRRGMTRSEMREVFDGLLDLLPPEKFGVHISDSYDESAADDVPGVEFTSEQKAREWCDRQWADVMTGAAAMNLGPIKWNGRVGIGPYKLQMSEHSGWHREQVTYTIVPK